LEESGYSFIDEKDSSRAEDVYHIDLESEQDINDTDDLYCTMDGDKEKTKCRKCGETFGSENTPFRYIFSSSNSIPGKPKG
jgi:hypothetical protein